MSEEKNEKELEQLKMDYLTFMEQINKILGYDIHRHGILLLLILESRYMTQSEIEDSTGYAKSVVSENLTHLTSIMSRYPVFETRKKGKKNKFYYTNLSFTDYAKINFLGSLESLQLHIEFLPEILYRIDQIDSTEEVEFTKSVFEFLLKISNFLSIFAEHAENNIDEIFSDQSASIQLEDQLLQNNKNVRETASSTVKKKKESLNDIRKDFISKMQEYASSTSRRKELIGILVSLFLSKEPLNQDELIDLTGHSRSIISEGLKLLLQTQSVQVVKKPKERKKYYKVRAKLQEFGLQGYETRRNLYSRIFKTIGNSFIPKVNNLNMSKPEKERLEFFFNENMTSYKIIESYLTSFYNYFYKEGHLQD